MSSLESSMKIALSGSDLDILACPCLRPYSMWWLRITGLSLIPAPSQYSRASMFTFRWSTPSWQMSARRKKMSVHCMMGYRICAAVRFPSARPMMVQHLFTRARVKRRAMSSIWGQYEEAFFVMSSDAQRNSTFDMSIPAAVHTSTKYLPTSLILAKSPPILSFMSANQSATQNTNVPPAPAHLFTLMALKMPCAMCILPDGSNPSYNRNESGFLLKSVRRSASVTHSSPMLRSTANLASAAAATSAAPAADPSPSAA
mmetsp:Transcript_75067/g.150903  ORF Transcript_75067/g.150903 Transcript_75067/m.150903 type:complete len:258 (+) Transcript_75067:167-940(+)